MVNYIEVIKRISSACADSEEIISIDLLAPSEVVCFYLSTTYSLTVNNIYEIKGNSANLTNLDYFNSIYSFCFKHNPRYIFLPSTVLGRGLAAWLGAKFKCGVIADVSTLTYEGSKFIYQRITSTQSIDVVSNIICTAFPEITTVRGTPTAVTSTMNKCMNSTKQLLPHYRKGVTILSRNPYVCSANMNKVIIGVGRGLSSYELKLIQIFASKKNILIMGSKPVVEDGILSKDKQIGQTGVYINADVYIAVGISGAPQHIIGIVDCKKIIAINCDEKAPIHRFCDISICKKAGEVFRPLVPDWGEQR